MEITKFYSPNFDKKKRLNKNITAIIIHYTGMQSERESIKRLTSMKSKVSCHYLINRKGEITKMVEGLSFNLLEYNISLSLSFKTLIEFLSKSFLCSISS